MHATSSTNCDQFALKVQAKGGGGLKWGKTYLTRSIEIKKTFVLSNPVNFSFIVYDLNLESEQLYGS